MDAVAVIFDVDGTLCNVQGIRHYVLDDRRRKDFEKFHAGAALCPPNRDVADLAKAMHRLGHTVIVVTARKERWRAMTATWLRKWEIPHEHLMMRPDNDQRPDVEVKAEILARIRTRYEVALAVDDNPAVIEMWQREGVTTITIPGWVKPDQTGATG